VIIISADHGENQGELNVWGDHQTADQFTCRLPLLIRWPGISGPERVDHGLHYHFDWAATLVELLGGQVPENWDGQSFAPAFKNREENGRDHLVMSQGAWSCQRGVRFDEYLCLRTYHDGLKQLDPKMLFNLSADPHEQDDISSEKPEVVDRAMSLLKEWEQKMKITSDSDIDKVDLSTLGDAYQITSCGSRLPDVVTMLGPYPKNTRMSYMVKTG
jgi:arylsulfatase A-like enzyme